MKTTYQVRCQVVPEERNHRILHDHLHGHLLDHRLYTTRPDLSSPLDSCSLHQVLILTSSSAEASSSATVTATTTKSSSATTTESTSARHLSIEELRKEAVASVSKSRLVSDLPEFGCLCLDDYAMRGQMSNDCTESGQLLAWSDPSNVQPISSTGRYRSSLEQLSFGTYARTWN